MFMQLLDQTGTICLVCDAGTRASCIPGSIRTPLSLSKQVPGLAAEIQKYLAAS